MTTAPSGLCPFCSAALSDFASGICPYCKTPHHVECWQLNGGCTTYGCQAGSHPDSSPSVALIDRYAPGATPARLSVAPIRSPVPAQTSAGCSWRFYAALGVLVGILLYVLLQGMGNSTPYQTVQATLAVATVQTVATVPEPGSSVTPLSPIELSISAGDPLPGRGQVTSFQLNVRAGPDMEYPILIQLAQNEWVDLLELTNGWWHIRYRDGKLGYAATTYIRIEADAVGSVSNLPIYLYRALARANCTAPGNQLLLNGSVTKDGNGVNGLNISIRFSSAASKSVIYRATTAPFGQGRTRLQGYYTFSHKASSAQPLPETVQVWLTDSNGSRISEAVTWDRSNNNRLCNGAIISFVFP